MKILILEPGIFVYSFDDESDGMPRKKFFPSFYPTVPAQESGQSFFDHVSMCIFAQNKQYAVASSGDAKGLISTLQAEATALSTAKQDNWILRNTSFLHELRHFHDLIGTSAGLMRFHLVFSDILQFLFALIEMKMQARERSMPVSLRTDNPQQTQSAEGERRPLETYLRQHETMRESLSVTDGSFFIPREMGSTKRKHTLVGFPNCKMTAFESEARKRYRDLMAVYGVPDIAWQASTADEGELMFVPGVPLNLRQGEVDNIALGYRVITESSAWVVQFHYILEVFGADAADRIKSSLEKTIQPFHHPYMVLDLCMTKYFQPFYMGRCTAFADYALNSEDVSDFVASHPGWRIMERLRSSTPTDCELPTEEECRLTNLQLGVIEEVINTLESRAQEVNEIAQTMKWEPLIRVTRFVKYMGFLSRQMLGIRQQQPSILANPRLYIENALDPLPSPPCIAIPHVDEEGGELQCLYITHGSQIDEEDIATWFFVSNLAADFATNREIGCPVKRLNLTCATKHPVCDRLPTSAIGAGCCNYYKHLKNLGIELTSHLSH